MIAWEVLASPALPELGRSPRREQHQDIAVQSGREGVTPLGFDRHCLAKNSFMDWYETGWVKGTEKTKTAVIARWRLNPCRGRQGNLLLGIDHRD